VLLLLSVGLVVSRFVLPPIFKSVARVPELVLVGALAWCFALAGSPIFCTYLAKWARSWPGFPSPVPYTLDVTSKVTTLRDFFVTLFFVGLGMAIPVPTPDLLVWMVVFSAFLAISRLVTVFTPLYACARATG